MESWVMGGLALLIPLVLGSYAYTWLVYTRMIDTLQNIRDNHLHHLQNDVIELKVMMREHNAAHDRSNN